MVSLRLLPRLALPPPPGVAPPETPLTCANPWKERDHVKNGGRQSQGARSPRTLIISFCISCIVCWTSCTLTSLFICAITCALFCMCPVIFTCAATKGEGTAVEGGDALCSRGEGG